MTSYPPARHGGRLRSGDILPHATETGHVQKPVDLADQAVEQRKMQALQRLGQHGDAGRSAEGATTGALGVGQREHQQNLPDDGWKRELVERYSMWKKDLIEEYQPYESSTGKFLGEIDAGKNFRERQRP